MQKVDRIAPDTLRAYQETEYRVHGEPGFTMRIGVACPELARAHGRHGADCSAFITACNPFSRPLAPAANTARQQRLAKELIQRGYAFMPGVGQHPSNGWPGEESFLVFGLQLEAARALAAQFQQNALVWSGPDAIPRLILLR